MMTLIYASCQRPEDCLRFGPANIKRIEKDGREIRVLRVRQAKTGKSLDIELSGELTFRPVIARKTAPVNDLGQNGR